MVAVCHDRVGGQVGANDANKIREMRLLAYLHSSGMAIILAINMAIILASRHQLRDHSHTVPSRLLNLGDYYSLVYNHSYTKINLVTCF